MNRPLIVLISIVSILILGWAYLYYSPPPKDYGEIINNDTVIDEANVKDYIEKIISDESNSGLAYGRAQTILSRVDKEDVYIGYAKNITNIAHSLFGRNRYWYNIRIGKDVEIDIILVVDKNNISSIQTFSLATR